VKAVDLLSDYGTGAVAAESRRLDPTQASIPQWVFSATIIQNTEKQIMKRAKFRFTRCIDKFLENLKELSHQTVMLNRYHLFLS
jgi:hypothetical protein